MTKASDFIDRFNSIDEIVFIDALTIEDPVKLNIHNYNCNGAVIRACNFKSAVSIEKVDLVYGVRFEACSFEQGLTIVDCTAPFCNRLISFNNYNIVLSTCSFNSIVVLKSLFDLKGGILIEVSQLTKLYIDSVQSTNGGLLVRDTIFTSFFRIRSCRFSSTIELSHVFTKDGFNCNGLTASQFIFSHNTFESTALLNSCGAFHGISFLNDVYKEEFIIRDFVSDGYIQINKSIFEREVDFSFKIVEIIESTNTNLPSIFFGDSVLNGSIKCYVALAKHSKPKINSINIGTSKDIKGDIHFEGIDINSITFKGTNLYANIIFEDVILHNMLFDHFTNFGSIHFITAYCNENNKENSSFSALNSSFENFIFTNFSFKNFKKISLVNSDLSKIVANNVKWFSLKQIQEPDEVCNLKWRQRLKKRFRNFFYNVHITDPEYQYILRYRELFRQLKYAMEQQGNRIQALVFKQYEMKYFHKELQLSKKIYNLDRIILLISCTNSHGQNWLKPAAILLSLTLFFSLALILIINGQINDLNYSILTFKKIYFNLLDPTHSLQKMFGEQYYISGFMYAVDVLYKIVYAYLVFQTVSAFRKYIK